MSKEDQARERAQQYLDGLINDVEFTHAILSLAYMDGEGFALWLAKQMLLKGAS